MQVQHPRRTAYEIAPVGHPPITTDDDGIADVPEPVADQLIRQGWTPVTPDPPKSKAKAASGADPSDEETS